MMKKTLGLFLSILTLAMVNDSAANDLSQAKQLCQNATEQQRQMARAAGYDVDSMCASLKQQSSSASQDTQSAGSVMPRELADFPRQQNSDKEIKEKEEQEKLPKVERELKKFGYDLFAGVPTTYTPVSNIPVPSNYIVGPGDTVKVQLFGKENNSYELTVERDGTIQFPQLGPINVAGLSYTELKQSLNQRISEQYIGVQSNVSLGELRSIQIFLLGESFKPGAYTVSSLSTVMNALYVSGGLTGIGSLRNIQLKRNGKVISTVDLYDLLLRGDTSNDQRLQSGDVIFIPSVKKVASVAGEVVRPATYELKGEKTVSELIDLAGGLLPNAYKSDARIERVSKSGQQTVVDLNLNTGTGLNTKIKSGDLLKIFPAVEREENVIELIGHVYRPGLIKWTKGLKLSDVLKSELKLRPHANIDAVIVFRETDALGNIEPYIVNLRTIWAGDNEFKLHSRDKVIVLSNQITEKDISLYLERAKTAQLERASFQKELESITNKDELTTNIGGYAGLESKIQRKKQKEDLEGRVLNSESVEFDELKLAQIKQEIRNEPLSKFIAQLRSQASNQSVAKLVKISGGVKFPGQYPYQKNMSVLQLIQLAGGLTEVAYLANAEVTTRTFSVDGGVNIRHKGISLQEVFLGESGATLSPFDEVNIKVSPNITEEIYVDVTGEVRYPGRYRVARGETLSQLINRVGGFTKYAHPKATVFSRKTLRQHEQKKLEQLQAKLRQDIAISELEDTNIGKSADIESAQSLLNILSSTEATGRLVIDIDSILADNSEDIILKSGDKLIVPSFRQEVTVVGEVQVATSHLYSEKFDYQDYIDRSGGEKDTANSDAIYIVKADGSVVLPNQSSWLSHNDSEIEPGDTIVVPLDTSRVDGLELWSKVSQIVYQLALGAAAVNSF
ncbi:SLBB domain-containing protein [Kangiella geojedonensis]|uniref:Polysaccharide export protein n=1 Tax=Kangiella geojedonensis TaxID=914150 RepID=A0A0F6TR21_9GAMM|nr:SLBB domain-containing protein [Kangiella geojedonensis]AKE52357.1 Polysaccharide export protein [Kangiella geojedonensis]